MDFSNLEISLIRTYRAVSGPVYFALNKCHLTIFNCRYTPSCSHYAEEAIRRHGARKGTAMAFRRVLRCRPPYGGHDPVK